MSSCGALLIRVILPVSHISKYHLPAAFVSIFKSYYKPNYPPTEDIQFGYVYSVS